jgi:hypothetical protein
LVPKCKKPRHVEAHASQLKLLVPFLRLSPLTSLWCGVRKACESYYPAEFSRFGVSDCPSSRKKPYRLSEASGSSCRKSCTPLIPGISPSFRYVMWYLYRDDEGAGILHHFDFLFGFTIHRCSALAAKKKARPPCRASHRYAFPRSRLRANLTANQSGSTWQDKGDKMAPATVLLEGRSGSRAKSR